MIRTIFYCDNVSRHFGSKYLVFFSYYICTQAVSIICSTQISILFTNNKQNNNFIHPTQFKVFYEDKFPRKRPLCR